MKIAVAELFMKLQTEFAVPIAVYWQEKTNSLQVPTLVKDKMVFVHHFPFFSTVSCQCPLFLDI